jgi:DNA modification methylase
VSVSILIGDCRDVLATLPDGSVQCCVTSPPYFGLRDYGNAAQIGLEQTPDAYVAEMVAVFREVRRVLRDDGTCWLNLGDSYAGSWGDQGRTGQMADRSVISARQIDAGPQKQSNTGTIRQAGIKPKDLFGIPWRVAFALQADGWYLRQDIIWAKPNPMPESVQDRCTKAHEYVFLLSKGPRYFYDAKAVAEPWADDRRGEPGTPSPKAALIPGQSAHTIGSKAWTSEGRDGRNRRSVWTIASQPFSGAHFATMPPELAETCIKAGSRISDTILDPFGGAGTTALAADRLQRNATIIELNPAYADIARQRINGEAGLFAPVAAE